MAGIGFQLQKIISRGTPFSLLKAYLYSSIIATGPLLIVMITVGLVRTAIWWHLSAYDGALFMGLIIYIYAFSLLGVGPFMYIINRYLADKYYLKKIEAFTPTYLSVLEVVFTIQLVTGLIFLYSLDATIPVKWITLIFYLLVNGIWIAMIFLSAARSYIWVVIAFVLGALVGISASIFFGKINGFQGFWGGLTLGQGLTFIILTARIFFEFGYPSTHNFEFLHYFRKHPYLLFVGIFYFFGIWIDKFLFWYSPEGETLAGSLRIFSSYDTPMFLAFLTIIPSMAFFLLQMETSFARYYWAYYEGIRNREDLSMIRHREKKIMQQLSVQFQKFVLFQGILSGLAIIFIQTISEFFNLSPEQLGIFRIAILGAFLQMAFMMILNILFYFDFQRDALLITFIYFVSNGVLTAVTLAIGLPAYGFGFTGACFITVFIGFFIMNQKLKNLNYWTFMRQPILMPKFKFETEGSVKL